MGLFCLFLGIWTLDFWISRLMVSMVRIRLRRLTRLDLGHGHHRQEPGAVKSSRKSVLPHTRKCRKT